jgi:hypothetical protein
MNFAIFLAPCCKSWWTIFNDRRLRRYQILSIFFVFRNMEAKS